MHVCSCSCMSLNLIRCVKWGAKPPSSLLGGIGQGLGSLAYEVAGGVKDFVSNTSDGNVKGGMKALVARPGIGGGILVQKVKNVFKEEEDLQRHKRMHSLPEATQQTHRGRATYDFDPIQLKQMEDKANDKEGLSVEEITEEVKEKNVEEKEGEMSATTKEIAEVCQMRCSDADAICLGLCTSPHLLVYLKLCYFPWCDVILDEHTELQGGDSLQGLVRQA